MAENKPLSFKNFTEEDVELFKDSQTLDEVLSISGRRKKARDAKRRKMVLKIARKRAKRRMAKSPVLQKRARRSARKAVTDKILKELSLASTGFGEGFKEAMKSAGDTTKNFQKIGQESFTALKKTLTDFVLTGKLQFEDLARTITRMIVEALIGKAISSAVDKAVEMFKMKSIRSALINVYEGATKAFAQGGILGPILAGTALAFGLSLVGKMRGFEKGGRPPVGQPSIVGEKGAELFVPDQAGTIIPNNKLGMGQPVTVNFNINTGDARGFNELLVNSRGTIVNMINNAVNEKGKMAII